MDQNLPQYRIFYEAARAGNISRAAKELYISQPAISKSISKLEDSLGVTLFVRNSRGVQLTEEGLLLYEHAKAAFDSLARGEQELKRIREFHIGHLRIGVSNTLCKHILLPYLKEFIGQYPHIKITIDSQSSAHTVAMLEQQQIDIGLIAEPVSRKALAFLPVMEIHDIFVSTKSYLDHLYMREGRGADIFQTGNIMLLDRENMTRRHVDEYLEKHHLIPNQLLEVTTMDLLIEFSKIGLGIGCVIREMVREELEAGLLVEIPLKGDIHKRIIGFAYSSAGRSTALTAFLNYLSRRRQG